MSSIVNVSSFYYYQHDNVLCKNFVLGKKQKLCCFWGKKCWVYLLLIRIYWIFQIACEAQSQNHFCWFIISTFGLLFTLILTLHLILFVFIVFSWCKSLGILWEIPSTSPKKKKKASKTEVFQVRNKCVYVSKIKWNGKQQEVLVKKGN